MKKRKLVSSMIIVALIVTVLSSAVVAYAMNDNSKVITETKQPEITPRKIDNKKPLPTQEKTLGVPDTQAIDIKRPPEKEVDISQIELSAEIADSIKNSDSKNFDKNIGNYKKVLVQLNVPIEFRNQLEKLMKKGKKVADILPLYHFLYDNFGTIDELEGLIDKLESGESLGDIIRDYNSTNPEFVPSKFEETYLENLMKTMSIDDIMIADRLSQRGLAKFEDLIVMRKSGKSWKIINANLGVINTADKLPRMSMTRAQVNKSMQDNGLNEKDATDVLVLTWKTGKDYSEISKELKSGKKKEDIDAEAYHEKYKS